MSKIKKNILILMPCMPNDNGKGAHKRAAAHIQALSKIRNVYLIVFQAVSGGPLPINKSIAEICQFVKVVPAQEKNRIILSSYAPFTIISEIIMPRLKRMIPNNKLLKQVMSELDHITFTEAFCFRIRTANILEQMLKVTSLKVERKIVDFDDIQSILTSRLDEGSKIQFGFEQSIVNKIILWRLKNLEKKFLRQYHNILICSQLDKDKLKSIYQKANVNIVPNRININDNYPEETIKDKMEILFVGSMDYPPNEDGVLWFVNNIYPIIKEKTKLELILYIVGFDPTEEIKKLDEHNDVIVTGGVESIAPYYENCNLTIVPIRMGGGTRIKILEAMSYNRAVVSTTIGVEGLDFEKGKDIIIADTPDDFANSCIKLIEDNNYRKKISAAGRKAVQIKYGSQNIAQILCEIFE